MGHKPQDLKSEILVQDQGGSTGWFGVRFGSLLAVRRWVDGRRAGDRVRTVGAVRHRPWCHAARVAAALGATLLPFSVIGPLAAIAASEAAAYVGVLLLLLSSRFVCAIGPLPIAADRPLRLAMVS